MANGTLKVENIQTSSGSGTITLGQSGETITVPNGATVSGLISNTPAFKATLSGNQTLADDTLTRFAFDTEEYDTDSAYDTSTYLFTCPSGKAGKYVFQFHTLVDDIDDADNALAYMELNGTKVVGSLEQKYGSGGTQNITLNNTVTVTLVAGDEVEVVGKHSGTAASQGLRSADTFFSGYRLIGA